MNRNQSSISCLLIFIISSACFIGVAELIEAGHILAAIDEIDFKQKVGQHEFLLEIISTVNWLHAGPGVLMPLGVMTLIIYTHRRRLMMSLLAASTMASGFLVNHVLKNIYEHPRPNAINHLEQLSDFGFPSGHIMGATIFYGLLLMAIKQTNRHFLCWTVCCLVAVVNVSILAIGRVIAGEHFLADVVAAVPAGIAWLYLVVFAVRALQKTSEAHSGRW